MPNDHYVAQTYLRHFAGPNGMLHAYRKSNGRNFPCWPQDICHEPNGDVIPDFLSEPRYLGEYRSAFEPRWNEAVAAIRERKPTVSAKLHIAGYWANLLVCTPAWKRISMKSHNEMATRHLSAIKTIRTERGRSDQQLFDAVEALRKGQIAIEVEADYVRAQHARSVLKFAWGLYNADWNVFQNETGEGFVTSDNPAAFEDQGDKWGMGQPPLIRYLPITPQICLMCDLTQVPSNIREAEPDFQKAPLGRITGVDIKRTAAERINASIAKCAEDLIICGGSSDYARDLAERYSKFGIESETATFRFGRDVLLGTRIRAIERHA